MDSCSTIPCHVIHLLQLFLNLLSSLVCINSLTIIQCIGYNTSLSHTINQILYPILCFLLTHTSLSSGSPPSSGGSLNCTSQIFSL